jgi:hypothetical protein
MPSTISLATKLRADFPAFTLTAGEGFLWSPSDKVITYDQTSDDMASLLHEVSHAVLDHAQYSKDIELIEMERDAWNHAVKILAARYQVHIHDNTVQAALDTYRDWLHARSTCPKCQATGLQTKKNQYKCIACTANWRVNEARVCALRRYTL